MKTITAKEAVTLIRSKWGVNARFDTPKALYDALTVQDARKTKRFFPEGKYYYVAWEAWDPSNSLRPTLMFDRKALDGVAELVKGVSILDTQRVKEYASLTELAARVSGDEIEFWTNLNEEECDLYAFLKGIAAVARETETEMTVIVPHGDGTRCTFLVAANGTISTDGAFQQLSSDNQDDYMFMLAYAMEKFLLSTFDQMDEIGFRFTIED